MKPQSVGDKIWRKLPELLPVVVFYQNKIRRVLDIEFYCQFLRRAVEIILLSVCAILHNRCSVSKCTKTEVLYLHPPSIRKNMYFINFCVCRLILNKFVIDRNKHIQNIFNYICIFLFKCTIK